MPGPRRRSLEPIPDALIKEALPPDTKAAHVAEQRRLLHVAMTRARKRLVLAYPERHRPRRRASSRRRSPRRRARRSAASGRTREEELFGPAETLQSTFRVLRDELMTTIAQVGGRLGELRFDTDLDVSHAVVRYLEVMKLSALMERTRARPVRRRGAARGQRAAAAGGHRRAARDLRDQRARRVPARRRARRAHARGAWSRGAPSRRWSSSCRAAATGLLLQRVRHRDLPDVPAEVQVRARVPDPAGADAQPALRDPRPPGARALPRRARSPTRDAARAARAARRRAGGAAASATPSRRSSCRARPSRR